MRHGWVVPAAAAVAAVAGPLLGLMLTLTVSPSGTVGGPAQGTSQPGLALPFVALIFGAPAGACVAAVGSYLPLLRRRPKLGGLLGTGLGIVAAGLVGAGASWIGSWWLDNLLSDARQTAVVVAVIVSSLVTVALALGIVCLTENAVPPNRDRVLGLLAVVSIAGFFVGAFAGAMAGVMTSANNTCSPGLYYAGGAGPCQGPSPLSGLGIGALLGSWVGAVTGLVTGGLVWPFRPRR
ncbi:MAG TPA: hypothetical protein VJQ43_03830 [Thermoplasmata archaeon]|nr:hypothetical protein [Thermoplasmata archaeon]